MKIIKATYSQERTIGFTIVERYFVYSEELWQQILSSISESYPHQMRDKDLITHNDGSFGRTTYCVIELEEKLFD